MKLPQWSTLWPTYLPSTKATLNMIHKNYIWQIFDESIFKKFIKLAILVDSSSHIDNMKIDDSMTKEEREREREMSLIVKKIHILMIWKHVAVEPYWFLSCVW